MANNVWVWDGGVRRLPKMGETFIYRVGVYRAHECTCGCGQILVFDGNEEIDWEITNYVRTRSILITLAPDYILERYQINQE